MITHEPLPLYEAFSFLTGIANDFSIEEFFEAMYMKHISKAEEYGKRCRILSELYRRLAASVTAEPEKITALFSMFTPRGRARDMHQSETIAGFFTLSMTVFLESDREKVFESIENSLDEVPGLIFRAVAGQMQEKAFADGEKIDAAEVFRAVNGSALPQKTKNALIDAALDPQRYAQMLREVLCPVADEFERQRELWQPLICDFAEFFPIDGNEKALLLSEMKYDASPIDECLICPSVIGFANAYIGTDAPEAGSSRLIAIIGTLFSTFRRNSESAENSVSEVARIMDILGEQNRFKIVLRLLEGSAYVGELAKYLGLAPCTVSQHLSVLLGANLVKSADIGRRVYYSLNKERTDCFLDALCGLMKKDE